MYPPLQCPQNSKRRTARPVWTCHKCYTRERRRAGFVQHVAYKQRTPGAITGPGPKEVTPETKEKLKALFRKDPEAVIHRLCQLLEGMPDVGNLLKANCSSRKADAQAEGAGDSGLCGDQGMDDDRQAC